MAKGLAATRTVSGCVNAVLVRPVLSVAVTERVKLPEEVNAWVVWGVVVTWALLPSPKIQVYEEMEFPRLGALAVAVN